MPVKSILSYPLLLVASGLLANAAETDAGLEQRPTDAPRVRDNAFPACVQFSPMPSGSPARQPGPSRRGGVSRWEAQVDQAAERVLDWLEMVNEAELRREARQTAQHR
jgi:hypothetical protein